MVMVSTLSLKGGRPVRAALRAARASYPLTLRNFFKNTGVVKTSWLQKVAFSAPPRVQEKTAAPSKRRAGATSEDWAEFFLDLAPCGALSCPAAVRPSGRAAGQLVRPLVRPLSGRVSGHIWVIFRFSAMPPRRRVGVACLL